MLSTVAVLLAVPPTRSHGYQQSRFTIASSHACNSANAPSSRLPHYIRSRYSRCYTHGRRPWRPYHTVLLLLPTASLHGNSTVRSRCCQRSRSTAVPSHVPLAVNGLASRLLRHTLAILPTASLHSSAIVDRSTLKMLSTVPVHGGPIFALVAANDFASR